MSDMILLGTRKGTIIFDRIHSSWRPRPIAHAGIPVCYAARDTRDGTLWAGSAQWQRDFLARPLAERRTEVESLRRRSTKAKQEKAPAVMDANPGAIRAALADHDCTRLIHGHTHRPGYERIQLATASAQRWVLSDWDIGRGDALEISPAGDIRRIDLSA